jgi:hypothetical protein
MYTRDFNLLTSPMLKPRILKNIEKYIEEVPAEVTEGEEVATKMGEVGINDPEAAAQAAKGAAETINNLDAYIETLTENDFKEFDSAGNKAARIRSELQLKKSILDGISSKKINIKDNIKLKDALKSVLDSPFVDEIINKAEATLNEFEEAPSKDFNEIQDFLDDVFGEGVAEMHLEDAGIGGETEATSEALEDAVESMKKNLDAAGELGATLTENLTGRKIPGDVKGLKNLIKKAIEGKMRGKKTNGKEGNKIVNEGYKGALKNGAEMMDISLKAKEIINKPEGEGGELSEGQKVKLKELSDRLGEVGEDLDANVRRMEEEEEPTAAKKKQQKKRNSKEEESWRRKLFERLMYLLMLAYGIDIGLNFIGRMMSHCEWSPVNFKNCDIASMYTDGTKIPEDVRSAFKKQMGKRMERIQHGATEQSTVGILLLQPNSASKIKCGCSSSDIKFNVEDKGKHLKNIINIQSNSQLIQGNTSRCGDDDKTISCVSIGDDKLDGDEYNKDMKMLGLEEGGSGYPMCVDQMNGGSSCGGMYWHHVCDAECVIGKAETGACMALNTVTSALGAGNFCEGVPNMWDLIKKILIYLAIALVVYIIVKIILRLLDKKKGK